MVEQREKADRPEVAHSGTVDSAVSAVEPAEQVALQDYTVLHRPAYSDSHLYWSGPRSVVVGSKAEVETDSEGAVGMAVEWQFLS